MKSIITEPSIITIDGFHMFSYVSSLPGNGGTPFKCFSRGSLSRHRVEPPRGAAAGGCRAGRVGRGAWGSHHVNYMDIVSLSLSIYIYMYTSYNAFIYSIYVSSYTQRDIYVCMHMRVCVCVSVCKYIRINTCMCVYHVHIRIWYSIPIIGMICCYYWTSITWYSCILILFLIVI